MSTYDPQTPVPPPASHPQQSYGRTALILGCIGVPLAFVPIFGLLALPVAIVGMTLGIVALKQVKKGLATNERAAWAGIALCVFGLVVCLFGGPGGAGPVQQQGEGSAGGGGAAVSEPQYPSSEHENAWESAQSYLRSGDFSEAGLRGQLEFEKYPPDVAAWAVANVHADWNAEALNAANSYMESGSFSRAELHDQLTSDAEQFTTEQADYAIANLR
ncbi:Ltp family lipoprotein [Saccharopolyspora mangrovi]|uniref:Ltp family lipoprotein n=1 Tax=Saccharopolyspora mangrovi TaxID=3082379 RepID=A0ABU6AKG4_9PSEU|nr:Ltp family lipoprotein [Saccharopolyspora sp. S2-29]MEB3371926.1 Ltp family lipoprotein [Saccharopolyspora sp. S2-29]